MLATNSERLECLILNIYLKIKRIIFKGSNKRLTPSSRHIFLKIITNNISDKEIRELQ